LTLSTSRTVAVIVILVAASLAGGAYVGYQSGYTDSGLQLNPDVQRLTEINANLTSENEALRKAVPSIRARR